MRRASSLVGMLVTIAIIAVLAVVLMKGNNVFGAPGTGSTRKDGKGTTVPGAAKARAEDAVCIEHLRDLRLAIPLTRDSEGDEKWPATLEETKQGKDFYVCPIDPHEPYKYNPETGEVKCVHPGHEKY